MLWTASFRPPTSSRSHSISFLHPVGWSPHVKIRAGAGRGGLGCCRATAEVVLRCGRAGWQGGGGLPVTPAVFGMRTRQLAWRWGLDLRVAFCCFDRAGQYSGPGARRP